MITENLSTLKIHKLTQEQYERELAAGRIDENALYLTPNEAEVADAVKYTEQTLTEEQQAQARANIGVSSIPDASSADFDGVALVVKNGEWVLSNIPVADKSDIESLSSQLGNTSDRVATLETSVVDWNETDETSINAIKNKPFGYVMGMVDALPKGMYSFTTPAADTTDIVGWYDVDCEDDTADYYLEFDGIDIGQVKPYQNIDIPDGKFYFHEGALVISGGNYPPGNYEVHIQKKAAVAKKLDSQWLNVQNNIYAGDMTDPVNGGAVATALSAIDQDVSNMDGRMDYIDGRVSALEASTSEIPNMINEVADKKGQELDESHGERVRKAIGNVACTDLTKNRLAFFSPENINVDYASSVPGWRVDFADGVIEKTNEYFAGANSTNDRKEIIFTPSADMIDIGFQTTSAHENSCTISNIDITRVDGGSMTTTTTPPKSAFEVAAVVVDESSFADNMNGWTFVDNSNSWYGAKLLNASSGGENAGSVCMKTKGWGGIIEKTISVTPGVTYNVDFSMRVEANGINFKIADGSDQNGAALVSRYLTNMENTLYQYTITPTGSAITIRFSGSGASSSDVAYLYDIGVYECVQLGMSNWHLIEVNSESDTRLDAANQMLKLRSPWNNYWGNYASVPVINPSLDTVYLVRFKANINSGVTNLTGRNISFVSHKGTSITIGNSGEHIVSFTANATDDCYLVFSGGGTGRDDVEIYDFNIFANTASPDALDSTQSRWVIGQTCSYDHSNPEAIGATLVGNGAVGYIYNLRTLAIPVEAGVQYKLAFDVDYHKPKSIDWSPYITFTNEDKTAFVTGYCANSESLQLGGPWVGRVISGDHLLKVSVAADSERAFEAQYLGIAYTMMGIDSVNVSVNAYKDGMSIGRITTEEILAMPESCVSGIWSIDLDSLQSNLLFAQNGDADKIEIIFEPMINDVAVQTVQYIDSISMHGKSYANDKTYTNDYGIDALKNVYFQNILFAAKFEGNIDDGDLDEGGLA